MNTFNYQSYIFPIIIILFLGYRFLRFRFIKKKLPGLIENGALIVDVRTREEFAGLNNPKSINIPLNKLTKDCHQLDKTKTIILCCASGTRSGIALGILKRNGFQSVMNAGAWSNTLS